MTFELLPLRATHRAGDDVRVEVRALLAPGTVRVLHLGEEVATLPVHRDSVVDLGRLPAGGYGVEARAGDATARTAVEVLDGSTRRIRYGFVTDYRPGRDFDGLTDNIRRLHLSDVQFYDWAYRHADLLGGGESYRDALDQPISLAVVRELIDAIHQLGARALGYAAIYGIGKDEWPAWSDIALRSPTGAVYSLEGFLQLIDPADPRWIEHFTGDLLAAAAQVGFDGFHLDHYGYPKYAARLDGRYVALEDSFATLIEAVRSALPERRLVFNNVNNFPTWRTGGLPQDAVHIEVWPPHTTLGHLATVVRDARRVGGDKPVVIAAYQHVYEIAEVDEADRAAAFTMAALFSHGATHLLCGEADRILVDPYYIRNRVVDASTADLLKRWYDFLVEHGDLLHDPSLVDMTSSLAGGYNDDCDITYRGAPVTETPTGGAMWRRVLGTTDRLVMHMINLVSQDNAEWDAPRKPVTHLRGELRVRRVGDHLPRVRLADPDRHPCLIDLPVIPDGDYARVHVPSPHIWQMLVIDLRPQRPESTPHP